jgi:transposase
MPVPRVTERRIRMNRPTYYIGIDVSAETFNAGVYTSPEESTIGSKFDNGAKGFEEFEKWLKEHGVVPANALIVVEATGVYGEKLCHFLYPRGFRLVIEAPHKVKRAFRLQSKTDELDASQIAEYGYRFFDELTPWIPDPEIVEQIQVLLTTREHFSEQITANGNILKALKRKVVQTPEANTMIEKTIEQLNSHITEIDRRIEDLINQNPHFKQMVSHLKSIPGIALLVSANLLVLTHGFTQTPTYPKLAAHFGIAPLAYESGTSVRRKPTSRKHGPHRFRKLLYLASMTVRQHYAKFKHYFLRKTAQGKPSRLVLNNIANKLIRIVCSILKSQTPYEEARHAMGS